MAVLLSTPLGDIVVDLFTEEDCAPLVQNFINLCNAKFYNNNLVYSVQPRCLAQFGDPTATGRGGAAATSLSDGGSRFVTWEPPRGRQRVHDRFGLLSMASMGKVPGGSGERHSYGSQFFFTLRDDELEHLDKGGHAIIGEVAEGLEVLRAINALYLDDTGRPWEDVRVLHSHVLDDPFDEGGDAVCPESPKTSRPPEEAITARVAYGAAGEEDDGLTAEEREEVMAAKKAHSQAEVLEMVGDLPHADVEVPKNELFIAKLNKVTEDADLEVIFSRFGKIDSCDIVRDWKTGDSLNFAFISFEEEAACVEAYKKMNNVLIDDSRVKVDFSQSVAKIWSRYTLQYKGAAAKANKLKAAQEKLKEGAAPDNSGHYGPRPGGGGDSKPPTMMIRGASSSRAAPPRNDDRRGRDDDHRRTDRHRADDDGDHRRRQRRDDDRRDDRRRSRSRSPKRRRGG